VGALASDLHRVRCDSKSFHIPLTTGYQARVPPRVRVSALERCQKQYRQRPLRVDLVRFKGFLTSQVSKDSPQALTIRSRGDHLSRSKATLAARQQQCQKCYWRAL